MGGLGNMLFQIAAAKSFAISKNTKASFYNLKEHLAYLNADRQYNPKLNYSHEYLKLDIFNNLICEPPINTKKYTFPFHYEDIQLEGDNILIYGFFQSEKYFKKHEKEIKEDFKVTDDVLKIITEKYSNLLNQKTTSIHVRRGDYVNHPNHHPTQSIEYYNKSIELLKNETEKYIVFSDDIEWCKKNFIGDKFIFIENEKDYVELYLMSMCQNNIISNSSFSWWGAWLNNNKNKTVIGPKIWFGNSLSFHNINDILPENWIKL
jgi:hypothetical protein